MYTSKTVVNMMKLEKQQLQQFPKIINTELYLGNKNMIMPNSKNWFT